MTVNNFKMELKEWKDIERESLSQIQQGNIQREIANILLFRAQKEIKKLQKDDPTI